MSSGPLPAVAYRRRGEGARALVYLAALVFLLQLPGPATCVKLAWRFTALPLETTEPEVSRAEESAAEPEVALALRSLATRDPARAALLSVAAPPSRRQPAVGAGTTRAPPAA